MCGRYSLFAQQGAIESRFDATFDFGFEPRYNVAPGQTLPVVTDQEPGRFRRLKWGLVPRWADDRSESYSNARSETVDRKPAFEAAYTKRRCIVPADGFYEWTETDDGKQPYRVAYEDDRLFGMAGLYERWTPETKQTGLGDFAGGAARSSGPEPLETFTILTTTPNEVVKPLHHRMAVILSPDDEAAWLAGEDVPFDPAPPDQFHAYPVSTAVNNPANDERTLIRPVEN